MQAAGELDVIFEDRWRLDVINCFPRQSISRELVHLAARMRADADHRILQLVVGRLMTHSRPLRTSSKL